MGTHSAFAEAYSGVGALVLGASGFIGGWTVRLLHDGGARVHAVVRDAARADALRDVPDADVVVADLTRKGVLRDVVRDVRPSIVFNLAGYGVDHSEREASLMEAVNATLVGELCQTLESRSLPAWPGQRLVHVGSALEYGSATGALSENVIPQPATDYGRTKLAGTEFVVRAGHERGLRATVVRLFTVYGPGEHSGRLLPSLIDAARTGRTLRLTSGAQTRDFTYVEDVVEGLLRLGSSQAAPGTLVNLATGELTSVKAFADIAGQVLGLHPDALEFGAIPTRAEEMLHGCVDVGRLEHLLGWRPRTSIAEGVRKTWEHTRGF